MDMHINVYAYVYVHVYMCICNHIPTSVGEILMIVPITPAAASNIYRDVPASHL